MLNLVIVESPAKARTIGKYLGKDYEVKASVGHVKDLPKKNLGVDVEEGFAPTYVTIRGKKKIIEEICKASKKAEAVYLAPDPDREGEAIAWHIAQEIEKVNPNIFRVLFNEITKKGVSKGLSEPRTLDKNKFESQQARRILDRLVGYQISPLLWKNVRRGLSAGRVQSVAVRLIVEREGEIQAFQSEEYWNISSILLTGQEEEFEAKLAKIDGKKSRVSNKETAEELVNELKTNPYEVATVKKTKKTRRAPAPFITSKLQQEAARRYRMPPKLTMSLAQRLYEGVDLGGSEGTEGLITYMRTDSTRISEDALSDVRDYIKNRYGERFLPPSPFRYKSKKSAQDAHEAIRPTVTSRDPETVRKRLLAPLEIQLNSASGEKARKLQGKLRERKNLANLYELIWKRFVSCQMKPAIYDQTVADITCGRMSLRAQGAVMKFSGYTTVYEESKDEDAETDDKKDKKLPELNEGQPLSLKKVNSIQKFTQPPPRYTEATLVKELEERGIGRPSTYASILSTIQDRNYVIKERARLHPTDLGTLVTELLLESFPDILNAEFTAKMENSLDLIEEGTSDWRKTLREFYLPFKKDLDKAAESMRNVKRQAIPTEHKCDKCGAQMVIRWGKNGEFLACSQWPECRNTHEFTRLPDGKIKIKEQKKTDQKCEKCGAPMVVRRGRYGEFLSCSKYPDCKFTKPMTLGISCPRDGCDGEIVKKRSRKGNKVFYGCSNYSKTGCKLLLSDRPVEKTCPHCNYPIMLVKHSAKGDHFVCPECKGRVDEPKNK